MTKILQGENRLLPRPLMLADKTTPLPVASIDRVEVVLSQKGSTVATYVLGTHPQVRATGVAVLVLEITTAVSAAMAKGPVHEVWTFERANAEFVAEPGKQVDRVALDEIEIV